MKTRCLHLLLMVTAITNPVLFSGCEKEESPTRQDMFLEKLQGEWELTAGYVKVDGIDVTQSFPGMKIFISKNETYSVTNAVSPIWPANGTFDLEDGEGEFFNLRRNDGALITVVELTDSKIKFEMNYAVPNGRVAELSGPYEFVMHR